MIVNKYLRYNVRIIQEYFQPKIGRKIRIFSLGRKNNVIKEKSVRENVSRKQNRSEMKTEVSLYSRHRVRTHLESP